jgi:hypothetical protein
MQTQAGMLARAIEDDRARERAHPARRHAAEARLARAVGPSRTRTGWSAVIARLGALVPPARDAAAGVRCTTPDGCEGRLVARGEGGQRVFVCEVG